MKIIENPNLAEYSSIHIGGLGNFLYLPESEMELIKLADKKKYSVPVITGGGTNLVFADRVEREVVSLGMLNPWNVEFSANTATASSGVKLSRLVHEGCRAGWSGIEALAGIPGTVGGAIVMNAGSKYGCIADFVKSVRMFSFSMGTARTFTRDEMKFGYRSSILQKCPGCIVLGVEFEPVDTAPGEVLVQRCSSIIRERVTSRIKLPNCGSAFKNPDHEFTAGMMIDRLGLKGYAIGGIAVSEEHGNILVNKNKGVAGYGDFADLIDYIKDCVYLEYGVELELEIRVVR